MINSSLNSITGVYANDNSQSGVYMINSSLNSITGVYANDNSQSGVYMINSSANFFSGGLNLNNSNYGLIISNSSNNNSFINLQASGNLLDSILDDASGSSNYLNYSNSNGAIALLGNSSNISVIGNITFPGSVIINHNYVSLNLTKSPELNKSANITLYNMNTPTQILSPILIKDGVQCPANICSNATSLNSSINIAFSVPSWGSYWVGQVNISNISTCGLIIQPNSIFNLQSDISNISTNCFTISASNDTINGNGHSLAALGGAYVGVISNGFSYTNINKLTFNNFDPGLSFLRSRLSFLNKFNFKEQHRILYSMLWILRRISLFSSHESCGHISFWS